MKRTKLYLPTTEAPLSAKVRAYSLPRPVKIKLQDTGKNIYIKIQWQHLQKKLTKQNKNNQQESLLQDPQ